MANIAETVDWPAGVYQYAIGDVLDGGPDSSEVLPLKQLANRALYQRLANVTPWDSVLAGLYGYPLKACVMHNGLSWRSKVAGNAVEPGTDGTKWERWGYSKDELDAWLSNVLPFGAPVACPNAGPDLATADKLKIHKSALGEYWMWLGDTWRVVAGLHYDMRYAGSSNRSEGLTTLWTWIPPRSGHVHLNINCNSSTSSPNDMLGAVIAFNGVTSVYDVSFAPVTGQPIAASGSINVFLDPSSVVEFKVQLLSANGVSSHLSIQYQS